MLAAWARRHPRALLRPCERPSDLLLAADLALETSPAQGFGLAAAEAGLSGRPVVAFAAPGVAETLGRAYPTVQSGDVAAAAAMLVELARDAGARAELGERLRRRVARRLDPDRAARRYIDLFESLLARPPARWRSAAEALGS